MPTLTQDVRGGVLQTTNPSSERLVPKPESEYWLNLEVSYYRLPSLSASSELSKITSNGQYEEVISDRSGIVEKFDGYLQEISKDTFIARLFSESTGKSGIEVEFNLDQLSDQDRKIAIHGAPLVWIITSTWTGGTKKTGSSIYVRRLPKPDIELMTKASREAEETYSAILWE